MDEVQKNSSIEFLDLVCCLVFSAGHRVLEIGCLEPRVKWWVAPAEFY
jgi:hypothetical protein